MHIKVAAISLEAWRVLVLVTALIAHLDTLR